MAEAAVDSGLVVIAEIDENDIVPEPEEFTVLYTGSKLFWRVGKTIDVRIVEYKGALVIKAFDPDAGTPYPPIVLKVAKLEEISAESAKTLSSIAATGDAV